MFFPNKKAAYLDLEPHRMQSQPLLVEQAEEEKPEETDSSDAVQFIELTLKFNVQRNALKDRILRICIVVYKHK